MARIGKTVVQVDRLRDQVYDLILEDVKVGTLEPGARLVEGDLAQRYNVSRTPVREALFQLSRDGLLSAAERGYVVAEDDSQMTSDRHEVRELIDPRLAFHAASDGTPAQKKTLEKLHQRQSDAHDEGNVETFIRANVAFRTALRSMCRNELLSRCSQLLDDQAQPARRAIFNVPDYRALEIEHDGNVMKAIMASNATEAEQAMRSYVGTVRNNLNYVLDDAGIKPKTRANGKVPKSAVRP